MRIAVYPGSFDPITNGHVDLVRRGHFRKGENVVFVHTGGLPALFAYAQDLGVSVVT